MKKFSTFRSIFAGYVLIAVAQSVFAVELVNFEVIREQFKRTKDETRVTYLLNRCAALQLNVSALLLKGGDEKSSTKYQQSAVIYMQLARRIEEQTDKKRGTKNSDPVTNVKISVTNISELYSQKLSENYAKRGDYIVGDQQIEKEMTECSEQEKFLDSAFGK